MSVAWKNAAAGMNPNSAHQWWSRWTIIVTPPQGKTRPFEDVRTNVARFMRKAFGAASQMKLEQTRLGDYVVDVRSEGHPVHDPTYVALYSQNMLRFFVNGFGVGTNVRTAAVLEAGSRQDGSPSEQLVILPTIRFSEDT